MAALYGSKRFHADLRYVVFDVPFLAGVDLRPTPWVERRARLELLAEAFDVPFELSPLVQPSADLAREIADGRLEGIVLKDRTSLYRDGSRAGWLKVRTKADTSARRGASNEAREGAHPARC
jgi:ATP-dependent DNA ligase